MAYTRYKGDPYWKRAKVAGTSPDGIPYAKGDRVFFYPGSVHRTDPDIRSHDCHPRRWPSLPCRWPQDQRSH
ncbi:hypothetical protein BRX37_25010 [Sphingomonas sp. S-NIH.Pt3_0716]|nr:hypothetical protein BRX37_25010 [Sphingomonas sp. S-NIH.Pt3_0716]